VQEAAVVKVWRNALWVFSEALGKEDMLRRISPKITDGPRL
jgi:DNA/RNA-binding domain of Phe-tRNA-synthetase-like protein